MEKIISKKRNERTAVLGAVLPKNNQDLTNSHSRNEVVAPQAVTSDNSLDAINAVVGNTVEMLIPRELLVAAPDDWNFFPAASADKIVEISESIKQYGLFHKITVWARDDGKYMILGGHTRVACFDYLASTDTGNKAKWHKIPAAVYGKDQITETDAKRIIIVSNVDQRELSTSTKAKAYRNLYQLEKEHAFYGSGFNSRQSAANQANIPQSVFYRYLRLLELIPELQNEVDNDKMGFLAGFYISYLPEDIQRYIYENRLFDGLSSHAATQLRACKTIEEIDEKLNNIKQTVKYYKYTINCRQKKSSGEEVLAIFVEKNNRNEIADMYIKAVNQSNLSAEDKEKLIRLMSQAKS